MKKLYQITAVLLKNTQIMNREYLDFEGLYRIKENFGYFIIRAKKNMEFHQTQSKKVDKSIGLRCDQVVRLSGFDTQKSYPDKLRRVKYHDSQTDKIFVFLTNNFDMPALTVAELYRTCWKVELFFKWIKQHLKIKAFCGISPNAVKIQIWIAISIFVMVAMIRKIQNIEPNLYTILQIFSMSFFEQVPILQLLTDISLQIIDYDSRKQLNLLEL